MFAVPTPAICFASKYIIHRFSRHITVIFVGSRTPQNNHNGNARCYHPATVTHQRGSLTDNRYTGGDGNMADIKSKRPPIWGPNPDRSGALLIISVALSAISTAFFIARIVWRIRQRQKGWDDVC
jgi:hypothetical protein